MTVCNLKQCNVLMSSFGSIKTIFVDLFYLLVPLFCFVFFVQVGGWNRSFSAHVYMSHVFSLNVSRFDLHMKVSSFWRLNTERPSLPPRTRRCQGKCILPQHNRLISKRHLPSATSYFVSSPHLFSHSDVSSLGLIQFLFPSLFLSGWPARMVLWVWHFVCFE